MSWNIVGHDWAVTLLGQSLVTNRIAHAYLFTGPPQIGKRTLAHIWAQALLCTGDHPPCGQCTSCRKIDRHTHPDVQYIEGQGSGGSIKIDQVRALQRDAALSPYEGQVRIFILRHMDRASTEAANSLLKTLEEPPSHVILALTAVDPHALPATVLSRCQRIDLRPVALQLVKDVLLARDVPPAQAELLARLSGGRIGWAITASSDAKTLRQREQSLDQLGEILAASRVDRFGIAQKTSRDTTTCKRRIETWTSWWRDLVLLHAQNNDSLVNVDRMDELHSAAQKSDLTLAWTMVGALRETSGQLEAHVNPRLALEALFLQFPHWSSFGLDSTYSL